MRINSTNDITRIMKAAAAKGSTQKQIITALETIHEYKDMIKYQEGHVQTDLRKAKKRPSKSCGDCLNPADMELHLIRVRRRITATLETMD